MNKAKLKGNWNVQKGKYKKPFVVVTDNDLMFEEGHVDVKPGKLHQKQVNRKKCLITDNSWKLLRGISSRSY